jgi:condensin complex subunit 1
VFEKCCPSFFQGKKRPRSKVAHFGHYSKKTFSLFRETGIQAAVVAAYKRLYIESAYNGSNINAVVLVRNLSALVNVATIGDLTGLEELIGMLVKTKDLDKNCYQVMWQMFTKMVPETTDDQSRASLILIGMIGSIEPSMIISNIAVLVEHGLNRDFRVAHDTCAALMKISAGKTNTGPDVPPFKLAQDHELFEKLENLLASGIDAVKDDQVYYTILYYCFISQHI